MAAILLAALAASMPIAADATASGAAGVFGLPTPVATPEGKARLGFGMEYWRGGDFLLPGATSQRTGAALSASVGFGGFIEGFGALSFRSTNLFSDVSRRTLVSFGDADLGVKLLVPGSGPFSAGVLLQLGVPSGVGGFSLKGAGGRAAVLFGYAAQLWLVPIALSALAGYRVDNSGQLVSGTPATLPAFALGISSYDTAQGGATLQVPLPYGAPAAAITIESPVARRAALPIGQRPLRARLALGVVQLHTERIPALSLSAAVQLSLTRAGRMSELMLPAPGYAPDPPWTVLAGLTWVFDRPALPQRAKELTWHEGEPTAPPSPKPPPPPVKTKPKAVLLVTVLDAKTQLPLAGAWVSFVEGTDVGGTTGPEGKVRVETEAGSPTLAVAREGYELLTEPVTLSASEEINLIISMQPVAPDAAVRGRIVGEDGLPLRATVFVFVPGTLTGGTAPQVFEGAFNFPVQHGSYELDATAPGYRATPSKVEADRSVNTCQLLLGESFLAQRVETVLVRLAAADRADVARVLLEHRAQRRQVELGIVRQDDDIGRTVDRDLAHRFVGPGDHQLIGFRKTLFGGELRAGVDHRHAIAHQLRQPVQRDRDVDRADDHEVGRAPEGLHEKFSVSPRELSSRRRARNQLGLSGRQVRA